VVESHLLFANTLLFPCKREEREGGKHPASHDVVGFLTVLQKHRVVGVLFAAKQVKLF